jgi:MFS family permease
MHSAARPDRARFGLGSAVTLAMILGGLVRAGLPVLSTEVRAEFDLSRSEFGLILTLYLVAIALSAPLAGRLTDATGGRRALLARFAAATVGLLLIAGAGNVWLLGCAVVFTGIGMAAGNPATNKLIADHVPAGERGTILGIKQSGGQFGVLVAGAVLPALAGIWSWHVAVAVIAVVPIGGALLLMAAVPEDPARRPMRDVPRLQWSQHSHLVRFFVIAAFMGAAIQSAFGFLPLYASEQLGLSLTTAGLVTGVVAATSTVGRILWGRFTDNTSKIVTPAIAIAVASAGAAALIAAADSLGAWLVWLGAAALGASAESWNSVANVTVVRIMGAEPAGRGSGLLMFVTLLAGAVGPYGFGALTDGTGSYAAAWTAVIVTFGLAAASAARWRAAL